MLSPLDLVLGVRRGTVGSASQRTQMSAAQVRNAIKIAHDELQFLQCDVVGTVQFNSSDTAVAVTFVQCSIDEIDLTHAAISTLCCRKCNISRITGTAVQVSQNVTFDQCRVAFVDMANAHVGGTMSVTGCSFDRFFASGSKINSDCVLSKSHFRELVLDESVIGQGLVVDDSEATNVTARGISAQHFRSQRLRGTVLSLERARLRDSCDFTNARVDFLSLDGLVAGDQILMNGLTADTISASQGSFGTWELGGVVLTGSLRVAFSTIGGVSFSGNVYGAVEIIDCELRGTVELSDLLLVGPFKFERNRVSGSIMLTGKKETIVEGAFSMGGTVVSGQIILQNAWLNATLRLESVRATDLVLKDMHVGCDFAAAAMRAEGSIALQTSIVRGNTSLQSASALRIVMTGCEFGSVDMLGADVRGVLIFDDSIIRGKLSVIHCRVSGPLSLYKAIVDGVLDLTQASLGELITAERVTADFVGFKFPPRVSLRGCRYSSFRGSWVTLLDALDSQPIYDSDSYRALEVKLRENGRNDWAETVYYHGQVKATRSLPSGIERFGREALDLLSGFGVRPFRLVVAAAVAFTVMAVILTLIHTVPCNARAIYDCGKASFEQAFTILIRGAPEKSQNGILLDLALVFRAATLILFGLFVAFITGLLRYTTRAS